MKRPAASPASFALLAPPLDSQGARLMVEPVPIRPSQRDQMREERLEVLRLLEAGGITADEAATLLDALDRAFPPPPSRAAPRGPEVRQVRIRVTDSTNGKVMVNLAFP